jgi:hypothetical protein
MRTAHDIYSETNPAYCACVLAAFVTGHKSPGPEIPVAYIALPIALSGDLSDTFEGTNSRTGLLEWLERQPRIRLGLRDRLNTSMHIVTEGMRFGCFSGLLALNDTRLLAGANKVKKSAINALTDESKKVIKHAERLGGWFAATGSTRSAFEIMGLSV